MTVHANKTKQPLRVQQTLDEPRKVEKFDVSYDAKAFGMHFKKDAGTIKEAIAALERPAMEEFKAALANEWVEDG